MAPLHGGQGGFGQRLHLHPPLLAEQRLHHGVAALAVADLMRCSRSPTTSPAARMSSHSRVRAV
jgi:hypothetical protein